MDPTERSIRERACAKINDEGGSLAYLDTPWMEIARRLLEVIEGHDEEIGRLEDEVDDLERDLEGLQKREVK